MVKREIAAPYNKLVYQDLRMGNVVSIGLLDYIIVGIDMETGMVRCMPKKTAREGIASIIPPKGAREFYLKDGAIIPTYLRHPEFWGFKRLDYKFWYIISGEYDIRLQHLSGYETITMLCKLIVINGREQTVLERQIYFVHEMQNIVFDFFRVEVFNPLEV